LDIITHGLIGTLGSRTGYYQSFGRIATISFLLGSIFPDIDIVVAILGPDFIMRYHRGITHSIIAVPLFSLLVTFVISLIFKSKEYKIIYPMVVMGMYSHILFDLITSYGTVVWDPFSMKRYSWNLVFILDPFTTIPVLIGLIISFKRKSLACKASFIIFVFLAMYLLSSFYIKQSNTKYLYSYAKTNEIKVEKLEIYPRPLAPFYWLGVIESKDNYYRVNISLFSKDSPKFEKYSKSDVNAYVDTAKSHRVAKLYYWFADFPVAKYINNGEEHIVEFQDLRFRFLSKRTPFTLRYIFDNVNNIKEISLGGRRVRKI